MQNYAFMLRYDGNRYHGWQRQNNAVAVEQVLADAVHKMTGENPRITGCSRTDAGVHALKYVCNFKSGSSIPVEKFPVALNTVLPPDIRVIRCAPVDESFHARFDAISKTYIYKTYNSEIPDPFLNNYAYYFPYDVDVEKMNIAAGHFVGTHDFSAFMASGGSQKTTVRTVARLDVQRLSHDFPSVKRNNMYEIHITADAYLYNMVRIIAGTLLYAGTGRINPDDIPAIIESCDRRKSGITAEACGLYLAEVDYGPDLFGGDIV